MSAEPEKRVIRLPAAVAEAEDAAHGGAWKVAYADFMTALMAFFLLMWILSTTEDKKLQGLADYFTPTMQKIGGMGGDGPFAGTAPEREGLLDNRVAPLAPGRLDPDGAPAEDIANPWTEIAATLELTEAETPLPRAQPLYAPGIDAEPSFAERQNGLRGDGEGLRAAAEQIRETVAGDPELRDLAGSLEVTLRPEGLELQILDRDDLPMFARGSAGLSTEIAPLVTALGAQIAGMTGTVTVTGHTDATPYAGDASYTNWELSTDRAHAARRALIDAGVPEERFGAITGMAATDPLHPADPAHPANRRITVLLQLVE